MDEQNKPKKINKYLLAVIIIIIVIDAVSIYAYTTALNKKSETTTPPVVIPERTLLTIHVGAQHYNYTLKTLTALANITGQGGYITKAGKISGPDTYTGVPMSLLLSTLPALPANYTLRAVASDNYTKNYTTDELHGHLSVYSANGDEIGRGTLTMIIAYKKNGVLLTNTTNGPLQIAFVYPESVFTNSSLWLKSVTTIWIQ